MHIYFLSRHFLTFLAYFSVKSISEYSKYVRRCAVMRKNEVQKQRMHCVNALDISGIQARFCDRTLLPYRRNQRSLNPPKIRSFPVPKTLPERRRAIAFLATAPFFVFPFLRQPGLLLIRPHPLCIPGKRKLSGAAARHPSKLPEFRSRQFPAKSGKSSGKALSRE